MVRTLVLAFFIAVLTIAGYVVYYTGMFKEVRIEIQEVQPLLVLSKNHFGPYHKIVPSIEAVENWLKTQGIPCPRSFGQFLDDPKSVEESRLRSRGGCILDGRLAAALPPDFEYHEIPGGQMVVALFEGSPGVGPIRVYPKVEEFKTSKNLGPSPWVMEIYLIRGPREMTTTYHFPLP